MSRSSELRYGWIARISFRLRLMVLLPMVIGVALIATIVWWFSGSMVFALPAALGCAALICDVLIRRRAIGSLFAKYVILLCAGKHEKECAQLRVACSARTRSSDDLGDFMRSFDIVLDLASVGLWAGIIRGVTLVVVLTSLMAYVVVSCEGLPDLDRLELGALAGMAVLVLWAHCRLERQTERALKHLGLILVAIWTMILLAALPLIPPLWNVVANSFAFARPEWVHAIAVSLVSILLLVYDLRALRGMQKGAEGSGDRRSELLQMCVIVDVPMVLSLIAAVSYWRWRSAVLEQGEAKGVLSGAIVMQFVVSSLLFVIVKEGMVSKRIRSVEALELSGPTVKS